MRTAIDVTLAKPGWTQAQLEDMAERVRRRIDTAERMIDGLLTLAVSDQGAASSETSIFEPFRRLAGRTASPGGVGLGLSIVRSVSTAHDARLDARPMDGGGLEVFIALRAAAGSGAMVG